MVADQQLWDDSHDIQAAVMTLLLWEGAAEWS